MIKQMQDMLDGEVGIIHTVRNPRNRHHVGELVHCYENYIIAVGHPSGHCWTVTEGNTNEVEILSTATLQDITYFLSNKFGVAKPLALGGS